MLNYSNTYSESPCVNHEYSHGLKIRNLGIQSYTTTLAEMQKFTMQRNQDTMDEIWLLEHMPVYTLGQAGKKEHILDALDIEVVQSDRGGQVTYHGFGQLVLYVLIDLNRKGLSIKTLVRSLEQVMIELLAEYQLNGERKLGAPGIYIDHAKIGSIGLRVKRGCSYHGLSFNINMDLTPFNRINPCGFTNLKVTQLCDFLNPQSVAVPSTFAVGNQLIAHLCRILGYNQPEMREGFNRVE